MAGVAEGLQVLQVECCSAPIDRDDVVDHLRRSVPVVRQALLAQGLLMQLDRPQLSPCGGSVELRIGVAASRLRIVLRLPRTTADSLDRRHGQKMMSEFNGRSWSSVSKPMMRMIFASGYRSRNSLDEMPYLAKSAV